MPRATQNKLYRTFVKGLITEAGYLTYPEDASIDELNTVLSRKGNRTRRLGIDGENGNQWFAVSKDNSEAHNEYIWKSVNNDPTLNFLCVQKGEIVYFYDIGKDGSITSHRRTFVINLSLYIRPGGSLAKVQSSPSVMISGKGYLFVAHPEIEPLIITYITSVSAISVDPITIKIRDFDGVDDTLANDAEPTTLSTFHQYNLQNQGWLSQAGQDPINKYHTVNSRYPGNNKQWWTARATAADPDNGITPGDFLPATLAKLFSGTSRAPRGHYILDAFRKDRTAVSGISGFTIEDPGYRPSAVSFFSGRAWWAAGSELYYSQIMTDKSKAGLCYQEADPTAEDISDLIASDGGVVFIPEATNIIALTPQANGLLIFATNGVWFISGGSAQGFSARDIEISKISPLGTLSPLSIVSLDNGVYYWSEVGIQALQQSYGQYGPIPGKFGNTNIAEATIQTYYNNIPNRSRVFVKGCYDPRSNVIQWLFNDNLYANPYTYNSLLNLDLTLQAFYPWKVSSGGIDGDPFITGIFLDISEPTVYTKAVRATQLKYVAMKNIFNTSYIGVAEFKSVKFVDWYSDSLSGYPYDSYVTTGYELLEDAMRKKQIIYLTTHVRKIENDYPGANIGACLVEIKWDWSENVNSNKWSGAQECYVPVATAFPTTQDRSINAFPTNVRRAKIRGSGKSIQFRFGTSEPGRTFDLLGWEAAYVGNTQP